MSDEVESLRQRLRAVEAERDRLKRENEWFRAAHLLIANHDVFVGQPEGEFFWTDGKVRTDGMPLLAINLSDTFYFACADAEPFSYEDAPTLLKLAETEGWPGLVRWVQAKRGTLPIQPVQEDMRLIDTLKADAQRLTAERDAVSNQLRIADEEVQRLTAEVEQWKVSYYPLKADLREAQQQLAAQTTEIERLTAEVARLRELREWSEQARGACLLEIDRLRHTMSLDQRTAHDEYRALEARERALVEALQQIADGCPNGMFVARAAITPPPPRPGQQ